MVGCNIYIFFFSGPNDHIFVFFTDHGAPGIIAFPYSTVSLIDSPALVYFIQLAVGVTLCHVFRWYSQQSLPFCECKKHEKAKENGSGFLSILIFWSFCVFLVLAERKQFLLRLVFRWHLLSTHLTVILNVHVW